MKRMSELKDNLRGVKCDATKEAFRYLKKKGRKPRIDEVAGIYYIRVQIDGQRYDYYPSSRSWAVTHRRGAEGVWKKADDHAHFYALAMERSAIRNSDEATDKQIAFLDSLLDETGEVESEGARDSKIAANEEISRLLKVKAASKYKKVASCKWKPEPWPKPRVSQKQWEILTFLANRDEGRAEATISEIAIAVGMDNFGTTTQVNFLAFNRLVERLGSFVILNQSNLNERGSQA